MTSVQASSSQAFHFPAFRLFLLGRVLSTLSMLMMSVAVGWHLWALTHSPLALGYAGLAQFLPMMLFTLPAGDAADHLDRRRLLAASYAGQAVAGTSLMALCLWQTPSAGPFYAVLVLSGTARAFSGPASASLLPRLVPSPVLANATTWSSSAFQCAIIGGPALGGALYLLGAGAVFAVCTVMFLLVTATSLKLKLLSAPEPPSPDPNALRRTLAGLRFVRRTPLILGAISLDLFAVLLGGATALLPIYASDILHIGPAGLGVLRAAPALGAAVVGFGLARRPLEHRAGPVMFACVALFGLATVVFAFSQNVVLSFVALVVLGAADMVSVIVRWTLIQLGTPDAMRGRVSALNMLFVGASNELGEFESGLTAHWFGVVPSVVIGGLGTIAVVGLWLILFPCLRRLDRLMDVSAQEPVR